MVTDHEMVRQLLAEYFRGFDARRSDEQWLRSLFTEDVYAAFPIVAARDVAERLARATDAYSCAA